MQLLNKWLSPGVAVWLCGLMAVGSVALACLGSERSDALMSRPPLLALTAVLACGLAISGVRAAARRRFDSSLLHVGCACIMLGWIAGRVAALTSSQEKPANGYMALADGFVSDELVNERQVVGKLPFSVRLMRFSISYYEPTQADRDEGRTPPVKEYCSLVLIAEQGQKPYVRKIRVNHPAYVRGYAIYQNSYREEFDADNRPVLITTLQFVRDPGLPVVYAGFVVLFAGLVLFAARVVRGGARAAAPEEASP